MADHGSPDQMGQVIVAPSEDEDHSPVSRNLSDDETDQADDNDDIDDNETEDDGDNGEEGQQDQGYADPSADAIEDEDADDEVNTSDLFPPTPRSLSPSPKEPQPLGLHRRFGLSSYNDYELVNSGRIWGFAPDY